MAFRFALRLEDEEDAGEIGTFTSASRHWNPGDDFYDADRAHWRVVKVLDVEPVRPSDVDGVFIVEAVD